MTPPASTPGSIHDVAQAAGVSTATVSRALRGLDRVSPETRTRVLEAAKRLKYVPSPSAASLKSGKTAVVGVIVPFLTRWFFTQLIDGAESLLKQHGYHVLLFTIGPRGAQRARELDQKALAKRVDGLLVLSADLDAHEVAMLKELRRPIVTVGLDLRGCDRIGIDDVRAARTAMSHLIELGHRTIGYVGGDPDRDVQLATAADRWQGVRNALTDFGVRMEPSSHVYGDWTVRGGAASGAVLLEGRRPPTAIMAASDELAIGVLYEAHRRGLRVPDDLSVIGIDDHEMSFTHELTTMRQDVGLQGRTAAELLLSVMSGEKPRRRREVITPTELVVRSSTGPVRRRSSR